MPDQEKEEKGFAQDIEKALEQGDHIRRDVKVIYDKNNKQFSIKIPKMITDIVKIDEGDKFRFKIIPKEDKFELEGKLIKNG